MKIASNWGEPERASIIRGLRQTVFVTGKIAQTMGHNDQLLWCGLTQRESDLVQAVVIWPARVSR